MAEARKVGNVTVNDGKGLMDNEGLIDSLIVDVNEQFKALVTEQYVKFEHISVQMVQKLANLKKAVKAERENLEKQIKDLTERMRSEEIRLLPVDEAAGAQETKKDD